MTSAWGIIRGLCATLGVCACVAACGMRADARPTPVAGLANVVTLALGEDHGCASTMDGVTRCWGNNNFAQLGNGTDGASTGSPPPPPVAW
jgi:hypothetical protein